MISFKDEQDGCPYHLNLSSYCNFGSHLDRLIFGRHHMIYPNDPEGLFTTLSAFLTGYAGYCFCLIMQDHKGDISRILQIWIVLSLVLGALTYPWTLTMPLNKKIWSISFVFLTSAIAGLSIAVITFFVDVLGSWNREYGKVINFIMKPFIWLGRNPLAVFVLMDALAILLIVYITIDGKSAWNQFYHHVFASWINDAVVCSCVFSTFFVVIWTVFAGILYQLNIFVKL
jgi:predicted acyltransferase